MEKWHFGKQHETLLENLLENRIKQLWKYICLQGWEHPFLKKNESHEKYRKISSPLIPRGSIPSAKALRVASPYEQGGEHSLAK